jgi:hypothetical protein
MSVTFLSPLGALLALGVVCPLAALMVIARRADRVRGALELARRPRSKLALPTLAAVVVAGLLGLAAAQPVAQRETKNRVRSDAEALVVLDVSRSMLARRARGSSSRFERAKRAAEVLRAALPAVPVGLGSLTDRVLPHLFPSADADAFRATVERAMGIERPPPRSSILTIATSLDALAAIPTQGFFSPAATKRLVIVLTDGESQAVNAGRIARELQRPPAIDTVFIQFWNKEDRVFTRGGPEPQYRPDPGARPALDKLAEAIGASVYGENELGAAARKARELLHNGPTVVHGSRTERHALAPYLAAAALLPLALLLWRRDR